MLSVVEARTSQGSLLTLPLDDISSGYVVQAIEGLDPVKATLVSSSFANQDGAQYHSSRRDPRNIKIQLGFEPNYEFESIRFLRNRLYEFFMPKTEVSLRFISVYGTGILDKQTVDILGRVESCESPLFAQEPAIDISVMCFDPDFIVPEPVTIYGSTVSTTDEVPYIYEGTVETGYEFKLNVNRSVSSFSIYHRPPDGTLRVIDFSDPLVAGDVVTISTAVGDKRVTRTRAGVTTSLLYAMSPQSHWHEFHPGANNIRVYATGAAIPYTITYTTKHGGL